MLGIFAVAFLVWIFSTTGPENKAPAAAEAHDESPEACLGIKDTSVSSNESVTVITGIVVNGCDRDFDTVRIKFKLSDQDGNVVGSASAEQKGLLRGERWKYTAAAPVPSYRRKLVELTGF